MLGLPVPHHLLKFAQVHVHCITDAIQTDHDVDLSENSDLKFQNHGVVGGCGSEQQGLGQVSQQG